MFLEAGCSFARIGAVADEPLEDCPWTIFHRKWRGGSRPRDGVVVHAAICGLARAEKRGLQSDLERGELRILAELFRRNLVDGYSAANISARSHFRVRACEVRAACARVIAGDFEFEFVRLVVRQTANHQQAILKRRQGLQNRRQLKAAAGSRRRPFLHDDSVRNGKE